MNKLIYFFKYCLKPVQEAYGACHYTIWESDDDYEYSDSELFFNELDWFNPSNKFYENFFTWYE